MTQLETRYTASVTCCSPTVRSDELVDSRSIAPTVTTGRLIASWAQKATFNALRQSAPTPPLGRILAEALKQTA